jgi:hypothetical protein
MTDTTLPVFNGFSINPDPQDGDRVFYMCHGCSNNGNVRREHIAEVVAKHLKAKHGGGL